MSKDSIYTSYWIPHFDLDHASAEEKNRHIREIHEVLYENEINALSAHYSMFPFLEEEFSNCNVHIWTNGLIKEEEKNLIKKIHDKEFIKVVLVDYKTNFIGEEK